MQNNSPEFVRFSGDVAHLLFEEHGYTPAESFAAMNDVFATIKVSNWQLKSRTNSEEAAALALRSNLDSP